MKNTYNNIDDLLRDSYEGHTVPEYKNSWNVLKAKLRKHYFFKFSLTHLNIYYSIVLIGITASILATVFNSAAEPPLEPVAKQSNVTVVEVAKNPEKPLLINNDMPQESQEENILSSDRIINNFDPNSIVENSKPKAKEPITVIHDNNSMAYSDSVQTKPVTDPVETISHDTIKVVKKIQKVYIPQKQVVVKDTVVRVVTRRRIKK